MLLFATSSQLLSLLKMGGRIEELKGASCSGGGSEGPFLQALGNEASLDTHNCKQAAVSSRSLDTELAHGK